MNSRTADKFVVRFPDDMRDKLKRIASDNNRSMNTEVILRLKNSFAGDNSVPVPQVKSWTPVVGMLVVGASGTHYEIVGFSFKCNVRLKLRSVDNGLTYDTIPLNHVLPVTINVESPTCPTLGCC